MDDIISVSGEREGRYLRITTQPEQYTTKVGDFNPQYRIAMSIVLSESESEDVIIGDILLCDSYSYYVGYIDEVSNYVYTGFKTDSTGIPGPRGLRGYPGVQGIQGDSGTPGEDGFSPRIQVTSVGGNHTIEIINKDIEPSYFTISDGKGVTVSTEKIAGGNQVTFTDINGQHTIDIENGIDGYGGRYLPIVTQPMAVSASDYEYTIEKDRILEQSGVVNVSNGDTLVYFDQGSQSIYLYPVFNAEGSTVQLNEKTGTVKVVESDVLPTYYALKGKSSNYVSYINTLNSKLMISDVNIGDFISYGEYLYPVVGFSTSYIRLGAAIPKKNDLNIPRRESIEEYRKAIINCACSYIFAEAYNNCVTRNGEKPWTDTDRTGDDDRKTNTNFFCALYNASGKAWNSLVNRDAITSGTFDYNKYYDDTDTIGDDGYIAENSNGRGYHVGYCACSGLVKLCLLNIPYNESVYKMAFDGLNNNKEYSKAELATRTRERGNSTPRGTDMQWTLDVNDNGHTYDMFYALEAAGVKGQLIYESEKNSDGTQTFKLHEDVLSNLESGDMIFSARAGNQWQGGVHHIMLYLKSLKDSAVRDFEDKYNCKFNAVPYNDSVSDPSAAPGDEKYDDPNYGYIIHCSWGTDPTPSIIYPTIVNTLHNGGYTLQIFIDKLVWYVLTKENEQSVVISAKANPTTNSTKIWYFNTTEGTGQIDSILKLSDLDESRSSLELDVDDRPSWMSKTDFIFEWKILGTEEVEPKDYEEGDGAAGSFRSSNHNPNNTFRIDSFHHFLKKGSTAWRKIYAFKPYTNILLSSKSQGILKNQPHYLPDANILEYPPKELKTFRYDRYTTNAPQVTVDNSTFRRGILFDYSDGGQGGKFINVTSDMSKYRSGDYYWRKLITEINNEKRPADPIPAVGEIIACKGYLYPIVATTSTYAYTGDSAYGGISEELNTQIAIPVGTNKILIRNKYAPTNAEWSNWNGWDEVIKKSDIQNIIQCGSNTVSIDSESHIGLTTCYFNPTYSTTPCITATPVGTYSVASRLADFGYAIVNATKSQFEIKAYSTELSQPRFNWQAIGM